MVYRKEKTANGVIISAVFPFLSIGVYNNPTWNKNTKTIPIGATNFTKKKNIPI